MAGTRGQYFVRSVERTLSVLRAFSPERPELTLTEVAQACGLDRAGARRILLTLVDLGYVRHDGRLFALTPQVLEFGYAYLSSRSLPQIAEPHLRRVTEQLREMTAVAVLDGDEIRYVAEVPSPKLLSVTIPVGTRFPAYATSMGKVLLAALPAPELDAYLATTPLEPLTPWTTTDEQVLRAELAQVREQGYAVNDQQLAVGLRSVAVPVREGGHVVAAANCSMPVHAGGRTPWTDEDVLDGLRAAVARIEEELALAG